MYNLSVDNVNNNNEPKRIKDSYYSYNSRTCQYGHDCLTDRCRKSNLKKIRGNFKNFSPKIVESQGSILWSRPDVLIPSHVAALNISPNDVSYCTNDKLRSVEDLKPYEINNYQNTVNKTSAITITTHSNLLTLAGKRFNDEFSMNSVSMKKDCFKICKTKCKTYPKKIKGNEKILEAPNYRELLSKASVIKNTISENDLNLEIIRRTLKCDAPFRNTLNPNSNLSNFGYINSTSSSNIKLSCCVDKWSEIETNDSTLEISAQSATKVKPGHVTKTFAKEIEISTPLLKQAKSINQPLNATASPCFPLDLSLKPASTTVGSTNEGAFYERKKFIVPPKIDFHPNFSIVAIKSENIANGSKLLQTFDTNNKNVKKKLIDLETVNLNCMRNFNKEAISFNNQFLIRQGCSKLIPNPDLDYRLNYLNMSKEENSDRVIDLSAKSETDKVSEIDHKQIDCKITSKCKPMKILVHTSKNSKKSAQQYHLIDTKHSYPLENQKPLNIRTLKLKPLSDLLTKSENLNDDPKSIQSKLSYLPTNYDLEKPSIINIKKQALLKESKNMNETSVTFTKRTNDVEKKVFEPDPFRIRTKGELKGFDLISTRSNLKTEYPNVNLSIDENQITTDSCNESNVDFNLKDWNFKCNDFLTQLVYDTTKALDTTRNIKTKDIYEKELDDDQIKNMYKKKSNSEINSNNSCSSEEDKPLKELCQFNKKKFNLSLNKKEKNSRTIQSGDIKKFTGDKKMKRKSALNIYNQDFKPETISKKRGCQIKEKLEKINCSIKDFSNKEDSFDKAARKRKYTDYLTGKSEKNGAEKTTSLENIDKRSKMKKNLINFLQEHEKISKEKNFVKNDSKRRSIRVNPNAVIAEQKPEAIHKEKPCPGNLSKNKSKKIINKDNRCGRNSNILNKSVYNRILRNKKVITKGKTSNTNVKNGKKPLSGHIGSKSEANSKKDSNIKLKKNQKRITRASYKNAITSNNKNQLKQTKCKKSHNNNISLASKENLLSQNDVSKFPPGWEREVFEYKKSLKIPLRLITIQGSKGYNASFPTEEKECSLTSTNEPAVPPNDLTLRTSSNSIIDILHSRAISFTNGPKRILKSASYRRAKSEKYYYKDTNSNTPKKANVSHFSVFDTEVLKARTRTESRILKNKEHIREIFVGEDRPTSAPPEIVLLQSKNEKIGMSFEEKFKQYLEEMNTDFGIKIRKLRNTNICKNSNENYLSGTCEPCNLSFKNKEILHKAVNDISTKEKEMRNYSVPDSLECDQTCLVKSKICKQKRANKYRKKGSSGFDYIKKKKKMSTTKSANFPARKKSFPKIFGAKVESDVCKEIKNWVINKSLGQSYLHKAARLGYLDVIAYCLERLNMDPNPKDNAGYTPLHEACQQDRIDIVRLLLQYGADHCQAAHSGIRPLHEASEAGSVEIIRLLLSYGADPLLTTYTGQTPLMLANTEEVEKFILSHIEDVQNNVTLKTPWMLPGPWKNYDMNEIGFHELEDAPTYKSDNENKNQNFNSISSFGRNLKNMKNSDSENNIYKEEPFNKLIVEKRTHSDDEDQFECEESDIPLPPLYILRNEGSEKWLLLSDLCHILKIKSKETLLKQIVSAASSTIGTKELLRELKITDFIEKAVCLQLLCAGEKLNIQASKVVLIKYNEQVKSLLGVERGTLNF